MPLKLGQPAPWAGQLLSVDLALTLSQAADACAKETTLAVDRTKADDLVELQKAQVECAAQADAFQTQLARANAEVARAQKLAAEEAPPWYAQPWFVAPVTAVITASAVVFVFKH